MTASSTTLSAASGKSSKQQQNQAASGLNQQQASQSQASCSPPFNSSAAFQQVKQTQASLARLCRVQQQQQSHQLHNQNNQTSQQHQTKVVAESSQQQQKSTTLVDCLIRRFKNCFSEDFCTVPMFVVGSLSPGSDGTHLILPPCVSLGGQNINRFASPKNLRLMNSIRESCRSIEELDLAGNKLTDLIEVYKILQCTPNLRFLNLSENDLSRTSPVAMAAVTTASSGSLDHQVMGPPSLSSPQHWTTSSTTLSQRSYLATINQNQLPHQAIGARRHSTLGQSSTPTTNRTSPSGPQVPVSHHLRARQVNSRVAEARRMAAANALAQSKKTSSKLAISAAAGAASSRHPTASYRAIRDNDPAKTSNKIGTTSTMHLARSLSSLSAKDIRQRDRRASAGVSRGGPAIGNSMTTESKPAQSQVTKPAAKTLITSSSSHQKLYVEPIAETEDVDMNAEQQLSPSGLERPDTTIQFGQSARGSQANQASIVQPQSPQMASAPLRTATQTGINSPLSNNMNSINAKTTTSSNNQSTTNFRRTFRSIKALALNNTGCQWKVVCSILSRMPNLEELHLSLNNYEKIDLDPTEFKHYSLKRLYLCNNPKLTNWEELDKILVAFPSLEALSIADCNISQIPDNLDRAREWRKLCGLNINGWPIKEWPVVERLNQLPSLVDLKCRNLEVLSTIDQPRHHLIARLPKLQRLNGSEIEEREDAEKAFLRFFIANSHLERPSRFNELIQKHGEVSPVDVDIDLAPPSHARVRVIYLNRNFYRKENEDDIIMSEDFLTKLMEDIASNATTSVVQTSEDMEITDTTLAIHDGDKPIRVFKDEGQEVIAIDVDLRQSVRKFKSTLASIFGLNSNNLILYYIDHEMVGLMGPELIKHNQKKLWNYNVQDGDQFIVEE